MKTPAAIAKARALTVATIAAAALATGGVEVHLADDQGTSVVAGTTATTGTTTTTDSSSSTTDSNSTHNNSSFSGVNSVNSNNGQAQSATKGS